MQFVSEHTSFAELYPRFKSDTLRHERSWIRVGDMPVRDLAFTIYYGTDEDGINLTLGILKPEQAVAFREQEKFENADNPLSIDHGALLIDLDLFTTRFPEGFSFARFLARYDQLVDIANTLSERVIGS